MGIVLPHRPPHGGMRTMSRWTGEFRTTDGRDRSAVVFVRTDQEALSAITHVVKLAGWEIDGPVKLTEDAPSPGD